MRRMITGIVAVMLLIVLAVSVSAATGVSSAGVYATVAADGSCQVTLTATLHLEQTAQELTFPIPADASNVTLNGSRVRAPKEGNVRVIDLSDAVGNVIGDFSVNIHFELRDVVHTTESGLRELELPMLSGFAYPVEAMEFSVTLPGDIPNQPSFSSGYHKADIEKDMSYTVSGAAISGSFLKPLKDRETLTMTLLVSEEMFPPSVIEVQGSDFGNIAMAVCAVLALLYWLLFLRNVPIIRGRSTEPPEGYSAGGMGCVLNMQGVDLSMMVLTWAQLGYVLIQIDRHDRVLLHKRMDMGNERSEAELRYFRKLFGKRNMVDTNGALYASLHHLAAKKPAGLRELVHPRSGNLHVFRALASGIGLFGGVSLAVALSEGAVLQGLVVFLLGAAGAVSGWFVQGWAGGLFSRNKKRIWISLGICAVWLLLGLIAGQFAVAAWLAAGLLLAGFLLAFGGRRTELGRETVSQVLGLWWYLRTVSRTELQRICSANPEYFYSLAPYALALGAGKAFARRFGKTRLPGCPYLTTGMDAHMTAMEWIGRMTQAADAMDARGRQMGTEKLIGFLRRLTK